MPVKYSLICDLRFIKHFFDLIDEKKYEEVIHDMLTYHDCSEVLFYCNFYPVDVDLLSYENDEYIICWDVDHTFLHLFRIDS